MINNTICEFCKKEFYKSEYKKKQSKSNLYYCSESCRKNKPRIYLKWSDDDILLACKDSTSISEVCRKLNCPKNGNSWYNLKLRIDRLNIDRSQFNNLGNSCAKKINKKHYSAYLVCNDNLERRMPSQQLKRCLIEAGFSYSCSVCMNSGKWLEKDLNLQVDHIDGDWRNNNAENLRFLCPNCHSQQPTSYNRQEPNRCENCKIKITSQSRWCRVCQGPLKVQPIQKVPNRPDITQLEQDVKILGYLGTGKKYGVTDNTIRNWIRRFYKKQQILNLKN